MTGFRHDDQRLQLREFSAADAADIQRLHADARVRALLPDAQPLHDAHWAQTFAACLGDFYGRHPGLGIWRCDVPRPGGAQFAGWFSLMPLQAIPDTTALGVQDGDAELGSRLLPEHWGNGLSLAGGEALLRHAFERLRPRAVWGICHPDNRSAAACLRALGFSLRGHAPYEGQLSEYHALDAATWQRVRSLNHRERLRQQRRAAPQPTLQPA